MSAAFATVGTAVAVPQEPEVGCCGVCPALLPTSIVIADADTAAEATATLRASCEVSSCRGQFDARQGSESGSATSFSEGLIRSGYGLTRWNIIAALPVSSAKRWALARSTTISDAAGCAARMSMTSVM